MITNFGMKHYILLICSHDILHDSSDDQRNHSLSCKDFTFLDDLGRTAD